MKTHADYSLGVAGSDDYEAQRISQAFEIADFVRLTSAGADLVVLAGDLNSWPNSLSLRYSLHSTIL